MKILMIARSTLKTSPGGDTVQIYSTARFLRALGVKVDVMLSNDNIDYVSYDLIHFFNIIRPDDILRHMDKSRLPFVVSTIFVDYSEYERKNRTGLLGLVTRFINGDNLEYLKVIGRVLKNGEHINSLYYFVRGHKASIRKIARQARLLLPNSDNEYRRLVEAYNVSQIYRKVPNAIDTTIFGHDVKPKEGFKDHILCVGRIEGRKNQLNLLMALEGLDLKVTLIGKPSPNHMGYFKACKDIVARNHNYQIIEHINHDELSSIYKAAKVHVLPSWFETTGLSSLEAAVMDCNIVVTRKGDTEEYFGNHAYYCEPDDLNSIRDAVNKAMSAPFNTLLKKKIQEEYTWRRAAEETLEAYKSVLTETKNKDLRRCG